MPPPPARGRGGPTRGASRGRGTPVKAAFTAPHSAHITTIGVRRPNYGSSGRALAVSVNAFPTTVPEAIIHHYDVISPSEKTLPARLNMELIKELQTKVDPQTFTPRVVYDGRKNIFSIRALPLGEGDTKEFSVALGSTTAATPNNSSGKAPKAYKIRLTKVAEVNPEVLNRFVAGDQSHDNAVLTAITALNVVIRMFPSNEYPFNVRSFFTDRETKDIPGSGLQLWRGYFQSVRPASGRMLINVDISTGAMYKAGPLLSLCMEFLGKGRGQESTLAPGSGLHDRDRLRLQRFIAGIRVFTRHVGADGSTKEISRVIKKLTNVGAKDLRFNLREGGSMTVADYFQKTQNRPLRFPHIICIEVGSGALIPLELCEVKKGQIMRKQVPADKIKSVLDFATKPPQERLQSILNGREVLAYGQSEYVRQFGMKVNVEGALKVQARVLAPPTLKYGAGSKQLTIKPNNGSWNMVDKRFYRPAAVLGWAIVVFENQRRFSENSVDDMIKGLTASFREVGITHPPLNQYYPLVKWANPQGRVADELRAAGEETRQRYNSMPNLLVVVLPEGGNDIYTKIKHFGDVAVGVATQCLKSSKCYRAKPQYYANVSLKINVKLGGINTVPDPASVGVLTDPHNPTIVMGADVVHPAPGSDGKPSFTALVGNVDSDNAKYVASTRVQTSRQEIIGDLKEMATDILSKYISYREKAEKKASPHPKRIIFYRDGVSEGQFQEVLDKGKQHDDSSVWRNLTVFEIELAALKAACQTLKIDAKITVIVVGKRHHVRLFPQSQKDADKSGNCPAGTVVDSDIAHPVEFDFYLQSHGGLLGTSRPAHYSILYDENNFSADALQSLSFALCHVYARSTRSVSIPAPVYYADIVCSRAKNHYDPDSAFDLSETASHADSIQVNASLDAYRSGFKPLNPRQEKLMYFS